MNKKILLGLLLSAIAAGTFAQENEGIYSFKVGSFEVYMMVEAQRQGNTDILIGASDSLLKRYIPETGFSGSTNTFLIKAQGKTILVDTAFGQALFEHLKKLNVAPDKIDAVLITHLHGDHFSGLQKDGTALFPNAKVYISERELEYWTKTNVNQGAVAALAPYSSRVETFNPSDLNGELKELLPGIIPIANYGHTAGHTIFLVENSGEKFIIWGDMMHVELIQFPNPDISVTYDTNPRDAAVVRRQVLDYAAKNKIPIGGMHLVYPGIGMVEAEGSGYKLVPAK